MGGSWISRLDLIILFTQLIASNVDIAVTDTAVFQLESHVIVRGIVALDLNLLEVGGGVLLAPGGGCIHVGAEDRILLMI